MIRAWFDDPTGFLRVNYLLGCRCLVLLYECAPTWCGFGSLRFHYPSLEPGLQDLQPKSFDEVVQARPPLKLEESLISVNVKLCQLISLTWYDLALSQCCKCLATLNLCYTLPTGEILSGKNGGVFLVCGFLMKSFKKISWKYEKIVGAV